MWLLFYGLIAIMNANKPAFKSCSIALIDLSTSNAKCKIIFCLKHGMRYFREYSHNGENDLEVLFLATRCYLFLDLNSFSINLYSLK